MATIICKVVTFGNKIDIVKDETVDTWHVLANVRIANVEQFGAIERFPTDLIDNDHCELHILFDHSRR